MHVLRAAIRRILGLFAGQRADDELREELASHVEMHTAENIRRGMSPDEARRLAHIAAGGLTAAAESVRERRGLTWVETLASDVRYGLRSLRRSAIFTSVAAITLALGIGANTAIFSVIYGIVLRPFPYPAPERLMALTTIREGRTMGVSVPDLTDWRAQAKTFAGIAAATTSVTILTGRGEPARLSQARISANAFDVLQLRPLLGRAFLPGEDVPAAPRVALLSEGLWRRRFGGDSAIVGTTLLFDGHPTTIVGIAPAVMRWPDAVDVWLTTRFSDDDLAPAARGARWLTVIGRLAPAVSVETAAAELRTIARQLAQSDPQHNLNVEASVMPLLDSVARDIRRPLYLLLGAAGFVLLISCANVANLTLGRVASRERELAVRLALGAGRRRIVRQILTESLLLALGGGVLGVLLALGGVRVLVAFAPADLPRLDDVSVDTFVLGFALALTLLTGVLFGVLPSVQGSNVKLQDRLRAGGRGSSHHGPRSRSRRMLVIAEMALAVVLLAGAGLLLRSFAYLRHVDPGFNPDQVVTFSMGQLPPARYSSAAQHREFVGTLLEEIRRTPGVTAAAASYALPMTGDSHRLSYEVAGRPPVPNDGAPRAQVRNASRDYFAAMGIPLLRGRLFDETDRDGSRQVVVISKDVARQAFPNEDPIGKTIQTNWRMNGKRFGGEVIGVVGDVRQFVLNGAPASHLYMSFDQWPLNEPDILVRSTLPSAAVFGAVRGVLKRLDPQIPMSGARTLTDIVNGSLGQDRFYMILLTAFAVVAMALALVGIYGVVAYGVQQRRREIGIRLALGATQHRVVKMIISEGLRLVSIGLVVGLGGAIVLTRLLESLLYRVDPRDPLTFAAVPAALAATAAFACLLAARGAARQNPVDTIRAE